MGSRFVIRRSGWLALALASVVLLAAGTAGAVILKGRGELHAAGNGVAVVTMRGAASLRGIGLAIVEEDKIVKLEGHGRTTRLDDGRLLLEGFGRVVLRSPDERMRFEAAGARVRLHAKGAGVAFLKGTGRILSDDVVAAWEPDAQVEFESAE